MFVSCLGVYFITTISVLNAVSDEEISAERIKQAILQVMGKSPVERTPLRSPQRMTNEQRREKKNALVDAKESTKKCEFSSISNSGSLKCSDVPHVPVFDCDDIPSAPVFDCDDIDVTPEVILGGPNDVVIGSYNHPKNLIVTGNTRINGSCIVGTIDINPCRPGCRYITGAVPFNPATQQLEIQFKDKSRLPADGVGNGAYIELEFLTTGTKRLSPIDEICLDPISSPVANVGTRFSGLFIYPKMNSSELMVRPNGESFVASGLPIQINTSFLDLKMTVSARINSFTKNIAFGFVPVMQAEDHALEANGYLFYGKGPMPSAYYMNQGVLAYKIVSDNVASIRIVGVVDGILQEDILSTLSDSELLALYKILQTWFGVDVSDNCRALELIEKNKTRLGWLLKNLPNTKGLLAR